MPRARHTGTQSIHSCSQMPNSPGNQVRGTVQHWKNTVVRVTPWTIKVGKISSEPSHILTQWSDRPPTTNSPKLCSHKLCATQLYLLLYRQGHLMLCNTRLPVLLAERLNVTCTNTPQATVITPKTLYPKYRIALNLFPRRFDAIRY